MSKIFVVEDDVNIRELTQYALTAADFETVGFEDSTNLYPTLANEQCDLILLDVMLPIEDGLQILKNLKSESATNGIPIIMLSAKSSEIDRVRGLDLGADDYITKPFSPIELLSRIKAVLRRTEPKLKLQFLQFSHENVVLDVAKHSVFVDNKEVSLTQKEFALLKFLLESKGVVFSRNQIMDSVWGHDYTGESRTVDMHIKTLRQKLGKGADVIKTIRGIGYKVG